MPRFTYKPSDPSPSLLSFSLSVCLSLSVSVCLSVRLVLSLSLSLSSPLFCHIHFSSLCFCVPACLFVWLLPPTLSLHFHYHENNIQIASLLIRQSFLFCNLVLYFFSVPSLPSPSVSHIPNLPSPSCVVFPTSSFPFPSPVQVVRQV